MKRRRIPHEYRLLLQTLCYTIRGSGRGTLDASCRFGKQRHPIPQRC